MLHLRRRDPRAVPAERETEVALQVVHTFGWYIRKYVSDAKGKGAAAVILAGSGNPVAAVPPVT